MQQYSQHSDPSVPFCCCSMPNGARLAGIIEIVWSSIFIVLAIFLLIGQNWSAIAFIGMPIVTIVVATRLLRGARTRLSSHLMPYLIWKPIDLLIRIALIIYNGVAVGVFLRQCNNENGYGGQGYSCDSIVVVSSGVGLGFASLYILCGLVCLYVVVMCYRYLKANPPIHMQAPQIVYAYPGQPGGGAVITGPTYGQPYGQPAQGYAAPPPPYAQPVPAPYYGNQQTQPSDPK